MDEQAKSKAILQSLLAEIEDLRSNPTLLFGRVMRIDGFFPSLFSGTH